MIAYIFMVIYLANCILILAMYLNPIAKKLFYPQDSEKHIKNALNKFDRNKRALESIDISDYKLGSGHIYN